MLKLYREGLTGAGGAPPTGGDYDGDDDLEFEDDDEMAEELLQWTQHLDFESYVSDWTSTACTCECGSTRFFIPCSLTVWPCTTLDSYPVLSWLCAASFWAVIQSVDIQADLCRALVPYLSSTTQ